MRKINKKEENMKKTAIKLMILSTILLVSMSSIVLGEIGDVAATETIGDVNMTGGPTDTNTVDMTTVETPIEETPSETDIIEETPSDTDIPEDTSSPSETSIPEEPVETPKSPGFGSMISAIVLLSVVYIIRRR